MEDKTTWLFDLRKIHQRKITIFKITNPKFGYVVEDSTTITVPETHILGIENMKHLRKFFNLTGPQVLGLKNRLYASLRYKG